MITYVFIFYTVMLNLSELIDSVRIFFTNQTNTYFLSVFASGMKMIPPLVIYLKKFRVYNAFTVSSMGFAQKTCPRCFFYSSLMFMSGGQVFIALQPVQQSAYGLVTLFDQPQREVWKPLQLYLFLGKNSSYYWYLINHAVRWEVQWIQRTTLTSIHQININV